MRRQNGTSQTGGRKHGRSRGSLQRDSGGCSTQGELYARTHVQVEQGAGVRSQFVAPAPKTGLRPIGSRRNSFQERRNSSPLAHENSRLSPRTSSSATRGAVTKRLLRKNATSFPFGNLFFSAILATASRQVALSVFCNKFKASAFCFHCFLPVRKKQRENGPPRGSISPTEKTHQESASMGPRAKRGSRSFASQGGMLQIEPEISIFGRQMMGNILRPHFLLAEENLFAPTSF